MNSLELVWPKQLEEFRRMPIFPTVLPEEGLISASSEARASTAKISVRKWLNQLSTSQCDIKPTCPKRGHHRRNQLLLYRVGSQSQSLDRVHADHFHVAALGHHNNVWSRKPIASDPNGSGIPFDD